MRALEVPSVCPAARPQLWFGGVSTFEGCIVDTKPEELLRISNLVRCSGPHQGFSGQKLEMDLQLRHVLSAPVPSRFTGR